MSKFFAPRAVLSKFQPFVEPHQASDTESSIGDAESINTDTDANDSVIRRKLYGVSDFLSKMRLKRPGNSEVSQQGSASPSIGPAQPPNYPPPPPAAPAFATTASTKAFLEQLPQEIYTENDFDLSMFALAKLTEQPDCFSEAAFNETVRSYERGLDLVNAQLCEAVIRNSDAFVSAMSQIRTLETDVIMTCVLCRNGRRSLQSAQADLTVGGLQILNDYHSKQRHQDLIETLTAVSKLRETEQAMGRALERGKTLQAARCNVRLLTMSPPKGLGLTQPIWDRSRDHCTVLHTMMTEQMVSVLNQFDGAVWERLVKCYMFLKMPDEMLACVKQTFRHNMFRTAGVSLHAALPPPCPDAQNYSENQVWLRALGRKVNEAVLSSALTAVLTSVSHTMGCYATCVRATVSIANHARDNDNSKIELDDTDSSKSDSDAGSPPSSPKSSNATLNMPGRSNSSNSRSKLPRLNTNDSNSSLTRRSGRGDANRARRRWHTEEERLSILTLRPSPVAALVGLRTGVWDWAQTAVVCVLEEAKLPAFKVDGYLEFVGAINDFVRFGKLFCANEQISATPGPLETTVAAKTKSTFLQWHKDNLDLLRVVIENEQWTLCPLASTFKFGDLKEMRAERPTAVQMGRRWSEDVLKTITECDHPEAALCAFAAAIEEFGSPWSTLESLSNEYNFNKYASDPASPGLPTLQTSDTTAAADSNTCRVTSGASLNVVKFFGRYTQIMEAVPILAETCFESLKEIANAYVNAVFTVFASEALATPAAPEPVQPLTERARVTATMKKGMRGMTDGVKGMTGAVMSGMNIKAANKQTQTSAALAASTSYAAEVWSGSHSLSLKIPAEVVVDETYSTHSVLSSSGALYGLVSASIAASSLTFVQQAISTLTQRIEKQLPGRLQGSCLAFEEVITAKTKGVGELVYDTLAIRLLNMAPHCGSILNVAWGDIKEASLDQNSKYVEEILFDLKGLCQRIDAALLPPACLEKVWHHVMVYLMECLVDAYAKVKKCSTGGRALMSLDLQMLRSGVRSILPACTPNWKYVENYIKAHYLIEQELMNWIQMHPEYRLKHIHALIHNLPLNIKRKVRNDLIAQATAIHGGAHPNELEPEPSNAKPE